VLQATQPFDYQTILPKGDTIILNDNPVLLYHPWHLDPQWRNNQMNVQRILVLEPSHFEQYPVSETVINFIIDTARNMIPDIEIYVGEIDELRGIKKIDAIYTRSHPCVRHFPGTHDQRPELFPEVPQKYYQSFFAYWKQVTKYSK
jgi:deoxyribodipyrimidine photo-lyase